MSSNNILKSIQIEASSPKSLEKSTNVLCRTLQKFYWRSKEDRQKLREGKMTMNEMLLAEVTNLKMKRLKSGMETQTAIERKAMRRVSQKAYDKKAIVIRKLEKVEKKEESEHSLPVVRRPYPWSIPAKYVSYFKSKKKMDITDRGISLKGLKTILQEYQRNKESFNKFIEENDDFKKCCRCPGECLTHMLVKPETRESDCYIEMLYGIYNRECDLCETDEEVDEVSKELDETLGAVNVFVSHAWQYEFEMLIESIEAWESNWEKQNGKKHKTFFYFLDYFAVNQHNQSADLGKLEDVIKHSKVTILILSPWNRPIPFTRCWCIYEIAKTSLFPSTQLSVAQPPQEVKRFKKNFFDSKLVHEIARKLENLDSAKAEASWPPDKEMIVKDIEENFGGFQEVNKLCIRSLRKSLIDTSCEFANDEARGEFTNKDSNMVTFKKAVWLLKNVGTFLRQQGQFEKSVKYLMVAKQMVETRYCKWDAEECDDKEEERAVVHSFTLAWSALQLGAKNWITDEIQRKDTLELYLGLLNSLANALTDVKQFEEAEEIYRNTLKWRRELLTKDNKGTKMTQFNLGVCLIHQQKYPEAEELLNGTLNQWKTTKKYHWWALFNLADLKSKTGRPEEAEKDFHDACVGLQECKVEQRDRFLSLANVLWSKHLLRWCEKFGQEEALRTAMEKVKLAYENFCVNSEMTHPDTRLAARSLRRLELKLDPELLDQEKKERAEYIRTGTYDRKWRGPATKPGEQIAKNKIRVMHWNILADKLAYPDLKEGAFGCPFALLDWGTRKDKICAEIIKYDPDVLILVELDHYEDIRFLLQEDYGYDSAWKKRFGSFCADGTGIFWKTERFEVGKILKQSLREEGGGEADQVLVAVELKSKFEGSDYFCPFVAAGCHLNAEERSTGEWIRLNQCKQILRILQNQFVDHPIILGADLNSECEYSKYKALAYPYIVNNGLVSSYANVRGKEPDFTSWKFHIDEDMRVYKAKDVNKVVEEFKYTIDFIFHSKELMSLAVLEMPEEKQIDSFENFARFDIEDAQEKVRRAKKRCLLPNDKCASDHLSLVAEILLPQLNDRE